MHHWLAVPARFGLHWQNDFSNMIAISRHHVGSSGTDSNLAHRFSRKPDGHFSQMLASI
jgi:hypothetical protein